jgi:predicted membrane metal-binding protein
MPLIAIARRAPLRSLACALALAAFVAGCATTPAAPQVDQSELQALGFTTLVATTSVQQQWVQSLAPGRIRAVQRNGKQYYIYPDAPGNRIYVGGPAQYDAYRQRHPDDPAGSPDAAASASAYRAKQDGVMRSATARDLSDPWLGASWSDLGW